MPKQQMREACHFSTKLVAMAMSLDISLKQVQIDQVHAPKTLSFGEKIAKIGPVDCSPSDH